MNQTADDQATTRCWDAIQNTAYVWIFSTEIHISLWPKARTVTWWSHDPMAGSPLIWNIQSRKNNKIWGAGENDMWGTFGLYLTWRYTQVPLCISPLSRVDRNLGQNHHIHLNNFYNSMRWSETLLERKTRACGIRRANRGIPPPEKKGSLCFRAKVT